MKTLVFHWPAAKLLAFLALMIVTAGCGLIPNPVISLARTSVPTQPRAPTQGYWEGNSPSVSFDAGADGTIRNFKLVGSLPMGKCTITIDAIAVGQTGKFEFGHADNSPVRVTGELTNPKLIEGRYNIRACKGTGDQMTAVLNPEDKPWKAEWKGDVSPPMGTSSGRPTTDPIETPRTGTDNWTPTPPNVLMVTPTVATSRAPTRPTPGGLPAAQSQVLPRSGSWQRITTPPHRINAFSADPSNPRMVYASTGESGKSGAGGYESAEGYANR